MNERDSIRWINHAGYELRTQGIRIVVDPWIEGLAFAQSWALLSETKYSYSDFNGVDYIWFSHEHPDHFSPGNLRKIPEAARKHITVLFQKTRDGRVAAYCRKLGFTVREIHSNEVVELTNGVHFRLGQCSGLDSWSFVETPDYTYLNMNDCIGPSSFHSDLAQKLPRKIDVLFTQFSYANWVANPGDSIAMAKSAAEKRRQMHEQIAAYKPKILIPFASYVWFCREENFHQNAGMNRVDDIHREFSEIVPECVVLYPEDIYITGEKHDSSSATDHYRRDFDARSTPLKIDEESYGKQDLERMSAEQRRAMRDCNGLWSLRLLAFAGVIKPVTIHLADLQCSLEFSITGGILWKNIPRELCDIVTSSVMFAVLLQQGYGYGTLDISARMIVQNSGAQIRLSRNFVAPRYNEIGYSFPSVLFTPWFFRNHILHRI